MSGVPAEIPELGPASEAPRPNPDFKPLASTQLTSEDYYVLSRVDGRTSLHDLVIMTGFSSEKAIGILVRLRGLGAFLLGDETSAVVRQRRAQPGRAPGPNERPPTAPSAEIPETVADEDLTDAERAALEVEAPLGDLERRRVFAMMRKVRARDYYAILGVGRDADKRTVKRAYFKVSKEFHPDRYYGKTMGVFGPWLATIFEVSTKAYETLSNPAALAEYDGNPAAADGPPRAQTKEEHAASLFEQACACEVRGDLSEALRLFGAVCRLDPRIRYVRRAAQCALAAGDLASAREYANKAMQLEPLDPSGVRLSASILRASGQLEAAEKELLRALGMKSENDVLGAELQQDLAAVRKLLGVRR